MIEKFKTKNLNSSSRRLSVLFCVFSSRFSGTVSCFTQSSSSVFVNGGFFFCLLNLPKGRRMNVVCKGKGGKQKCQKNNGWWGFRLGSRVGLSIVYLRVERRKQNL